MQLAANALLMMTTGDAREREFVLSAERESGDAS